MVDSKPIKRAHNFKDLTSEPPFDRLTVLAFAYMRNQRSYWLCRCDCGAERIVRASALKSANTRSCGCLASEVTAARNRIHGMTHSPEHVVWLAMIQRCTDANKDNFKYYGGRGITVCARWRESFEAFYADMGPRPSLKHSIDRFPDVDGNYEPGNCRWATLDEQHANKRNSRYLTCNGTTLTITEWSRHTGLSVACIKHRLERGWTVEKALAHFTRQSPFSGGRRQ